MRFELASYKSTRSKEALMKIELTIDELEYMYGLVDRESIISDALYGFAGGTRKERSINKKMHEKLDKMIRLNNPPINENTAASCS